MDWGTGEEVSENIMFLVSPRARWMAERNIAAAAPEQ
jgi:hypothetical protein